MIMNSTVKDFIVSPGTTYFETVVLRTCRTSNSYPWGYIPIWSRAYKVGNDAKY